MNRRNLLKLPLVALVPTPAPFITKTAAVGMTTIAGYDDTVTVYFMPKYALSYIRLEFMLEKLKPCLFLPSSSPISPDAPLTSE